MRLFLLSEISFPEWLVVPFLTGVGVAYAWIWQRVLCKPAPRDPKGGRRVLVLPTQPTTRESRKAA